MEEKDKQKDKLSEEDKKKLEVLASGPKDEVKKDSKLVNL